MRQAKYVMKKVYNLLPRRDLDRERFGPEVDLFLNLSAESRLRKIFGTNEKGILILVPGLNCYTIQYLFVREEFRHQGVARDLLDSAFLYCKRYHATFMIRVLFNDTFAAALERYAICRGMQPATSQRLFILYRDRFYNEKVFFWIDHRLLPVATRFLDKGYVVTPFNEAPGEVLAKMKRYFNEKNVPTWETPSDMNPFRHRMDPDLSFLCWKDDDPVAYLCVERFGDSVVVNEHFCFRKYFRSGVSIVPLARFAEEVRRDSSIRRISFIILDGNLQALRMLNRQYGNFDPKETLQKVFFIKNPPKVNF